MKSKAGLNRESLIWLLLRQTSNVIVGLIEDEMRLSGKVSYTRATILFLVKAAGNRATPAEISRWIIREPHTISAILNRMQEDGLVRKVKDLERKNWVRIELTDKGEEALRQAMDIEIIGTIISSLSDEEQDILLSYLNKLRTKSFEEYRASRRKTTLPIGFIDSPIPQS
ncbi:MAG: winged helix DNA-binding protein [Dehalococcoidia bacterium]|nr:winged helix DNA-binding protein [Dehalococcoidia bacterium]